jgi:hypothetical protein
MSKALRYVLWGIAAVLVVVAFLIPEPVKIEQKKNDIPEDEEEANDYSPSADTGGIEEAEVIQDGEEKRE